MEVHGQLVDGQQLCVGSLLFRHQLARAHSTAECARMWLSCRKISA
jgi:hypothetical protein